MLVATQRVAENNVGKDDDCYVYGATALHVRLDRSRGRTSRIILNFSLHEALCGSGIIGGMIVALVQR